VSLDEQEEEKEELALGGKAFLTRGSHLC